MKVIQSVSNGIFKIEKLLVILLISSMLIAMILDVLFRYFVKSPLVWGQEVALYSFVWSSFIGASMSIKVKEAVAVTLFVQKMKSNLKNAMILLGLLASTTFIIFFFYQSLVWILNPSILLQKSVTTQTPMIYMYLCIPTSLLFMSIHFINWLLEALRIAKSGKVID
ncbi:TRAP transporter small permease subunit [Bacillus sp. FJAT-27251]|uniref:TRAP transporter small permease n=1 Tax=Bacillus sp. FJAT-27251 TaxID=1684142 RepID=UPI0006A78CC3|nr:TRAP transporter small permease subunit [Bacillus sp. FJAT-27251]